MMATSPSSRTTVRPGNVYGGQIMTALGTDAPNVVGLVYIAAFGLDEAQRLFASRMGQPPSRSPRATWPWCPTRETWRSSSRRLPKPCQPRAEPTGR